MTRIQFECSHCQQSIECPSELYGEVIHCPACQASLQLPPAPVSPHGNRKSVQNRRQLQEEKAAAPAPVKFTFVEHLMMMWPIYAVIIWGTFLGGPRVRLSFGEASGTGSFVGGTVWPLISFGIIGALNSGILYTRLPFSAKFALTVVAGILYILLWPSIAPKPS